MDDGAFRVTRPKKQQVGKALLVAVMFDGYTFTGLRLGRIRVDGLDATSVLCRMLRRLSFSFVLLSGISFAGFNLVDATTVYQRFRKPVIVVTGSAPDNRAVRRALRQHFADWEVRWGIVAKLGRIHKVAPVWAEPPLYFEVVGGTVARARELIRQLSKTSRVPEPIRVARLVARGLTSADE